MNKSFTLIEILVVIVVIGILSAFILVGMSSINSSANIAKNQAFLNSMNNSLLLARVSQWKLDETSGITAYDSWGTNNGTLLGGATIPLIQTTGCVSNNCLYFDGTDDYVDCGNNVGLNLTNSFTLSVWLKSYNSDVGYIIGRFEATDAGYIMRWDDVGLTLWYGDTENVNSNAFTSSSNWTLAIISFNSGTVNFYRNGAAIGTTSGITIGTAVSTHNTIGTRYNGSSVGHFFNGLIDDARIYNQAIPTSEIQQNYFVGISKLFKNNGIGLKEFNLRIAELKSSLVFDK